MTGRPAVSVGLRRAFTGEPLVPHLNFGGGENANPPSTANTYTAWVEYIPATAEDWDGFDLNMYFNGAGHNARTLFQIGIGTAGSEVVLGGAFGGGITIGYSQHNAIAFIPVFIPRGSRIAVRWKVNVAWPASERPGLNIALVGRRASDVGQSFGNHAVYGVTEATTYGSITLSHTYGDYAWRELVASTPFRVRKIIINQILSEYAGTVNTRNFSVGIGAASSEVELMQISLSPFTPLNAIDVDIPHGTRIAHRLNQISNDGAGTCIVIVHLFG